MLNRSKFTIFIIIEILFLLPILFFYYSNSEVSKAYNSFETKLEIYKDQGWNIAQAEQNYYNLKSKSLFEDILNFQSTPERIVQTQEEIESDQKGLKEQLKSELSKEYDTFNSFSIPELDSEIQRTERALKAVDYFISDGNYYAAQIGLENLKLEMQTLEIKQEGIAEEKYAQLQEKVQKLNKLCTVYKCKISDYKEDTQSDIISKYKDYLSYYENAKKEFNTYAKNRGSWESNKRIIVSITKQYLYMVEDYEIIDSFPAATGIQGHGTSAGEFQILEKLGTVWGYYDIWMPYWMTIYYSGGLKNGIHGIPWYPTGQRWTFWEDRIGLEPLTYGCVMPHDIKVKELYEWAEVGIPVSILW
jgi:hypothetical protein